MMAMCKTSSDIDALIFETLWQNLRTTPLGDEHKANLSKSTLWSSKPPFMKKMWMQKYLNLIFKPDN